MKKFELTDETVIINIVSQDGETNGKIKLYRIRALKSFSDVKAGDLGGYVEREENLAQEGMCWIYDDAYVYGSAVISDGAAVYDDAEVCGNAQVFGCAKIKENAFVHDNAVVCDNAVVAGDAVVFGNAQIDEGKELYTGVFSGENRHCITITCNL